MRYAIIIEKGKRNYSAYAPDVPGCVAAAKTVRQTRKLMKEALEFHFEGMLLDGEEIPPASCDCTSVSIDVGKIAKKLVKHKRGQTRSAS
jgi:predicted RNase H-like HicB family nuclease